MIDFKNVKDWLIPNGKVVKVEQGGNVLWKIDNDISGAWQFNDTINFSVNEKWNINFVKLINNDTKYIALNSRYNPNDITDNELKYYTSETAGQVAYREANGLGWAKEEFKIIYIQKQDTYPQNLIDFLEANATRNILDLLGTWQLNDNPDLSKVILDIISFTSNNTEYNKIRIEHDTANNKKYIKYDEYIAYSLSNGSVFGTWTNLNLKTIKITNVSKIIRPQELKDWLLANATKVS